MLTPNVVILNQVTHYLVAYPKKVDEIRKLVVASGTCNNIPFEATAINDPDFSTRLELFRTDNERFSKLEFQSIQRRIKMEKPLETFDLRSDPEARGYEYFSDQMREKYYGQKIYLNVSFARKDEAKKLGAEWDNAAKKWFLYSNSPDLKRAEKYFKRDAQ